ncbi:MULTISPECIES: thiamine-phosphate kinase [Thalassobaculum]|uniref:Thiamine-monophosphate kinase n=1 Tax=Thalassobaculum litoreum DSM 18839 TaxID=1123362 RepID=A0A8G2BGE9_9PROT|nr:MULTISPECIES: thiamine-phosphate kinase [Thalassobaculum]SDF10580.1 thiamine-phosphate kinase [Thalassobaculum litoreum DSM 18839]
MTEDSEALGEFDRIARFFAPLAKDAPGAFGLTDDAAALPPLAEGQEWVVTVDALVSAVHFLPDDPPELVARKALRVNLSDLAAMGAVPYGYTLALALPKDMAEPQRWLAAFSRGLAADQAEFGIHLLGGDSVSTPGPVTLSITAFGRGPRDGVLRRSGAAPGQDVWVSGTIGDGALGLRVAQGLLSGRFADLADRYRLPAPRVTLGPRLAGLATAALDVSDGLVQDAGHIATHSGCRLVIEAPLVPISASVADLVSDDPDLFAEVLTGGDDYELLFTAAPEAADAIEAAGREAGVSVTRIGRVQSGAGVEVLDHHGAPLDGLTARGWRHF